LAAQAIESIWRTMPGLENPMQSSVLIAYATRSGSTGEVAQAIGASISEAGLRAEVAPMGSVNSIGARTAVVLGAPLYMGKLPGAVSRFLLRNRTPLAGLKVWFFVLGPIEGKPEEFAAAAQAEKQLAKLVWFKPAELRIFGGKFDVNHMPFPFSLARYLPAFPAKSMLPKDIRDWEAIRSWASQIARQIQAPA
jgi:menaquinone-dependent protoporphyrinogen oxidase